MKTLQDFVQMQETVRNLIECVFMYDTEFKPLLNVSWSEEYYTIQRCHVSGNVMRVTLEFDEGSTYDVYVDLQDVIKWFMNKQESVLGSEDKVPTLQEQLSMASKHK